MFFDAIRDAFHAAPPCYYPISDAEPFKNDEYEVYQIANVRATKPDRESRVIKWK
jgi:hypothetical protein